MVLSGKFTVPILFVVLCSISSLVQGQGFPRGKRLYRSLPSVSNDHYQEVRPDGTYKYAYTGPNRYAAERRLRDGTVEGETLYVRPDGVPVKVHYFADSHGYRPKTEVLYAERLAAARNVVVPAAVVRGANDLEVRSAGDELAVGNSRFSGDTAIAQPSVTAIVGPGGSAHIAPEAVARTGNNYYRSASGGDTAIAKPSVHAVVGPGGSVSIAPRATALTGSAAVGDHPVVVSRTVIPPPVTQVIREVVPSPPVTYVKEVPVYRDVPRPVPVPVVTASVPRRGYVYSPPEIRAVQAQGVVVVPPSASYAYEYGYSAPDEKHPAYGQNRAYVNVRVNQ